MSAFGRAIERFSPAALRVAGLSVLSTGAGAVLGLIAALGMGAGSMADFGAAFGAAVGLLLAPALVWGAWHESPARAAAFILPPTAMAAWAGGWLTPRPGAPFLAMGLSVTVYLLASYAFGVRSRVRRVRAGRIRRNECAACGYSLHGLPAGTACPECGAAPPRP